jgi:NarL family two-component system response regulator LiaR
MVISVLLVEDHKIVREGTRQLLEQYADIKVVGEASNGLEAITIIEEKQPDIIVMDVRLPKLNGIESTRIITNRYPNIKVLILSAYDDDSYVYPLFKAGASGYLLKSLSGAELADAIHVVNEGGTAISPQISSKLVSHLGSSQRYRKANMPQGITKREMEVLRAAAYGHANKIIAVELGISIQTVQVHLRNIFRKLQVNSRSEAIAYAIQYGWITLEINE